MAWRGCRAWLTVVCPAAALLAWVAGCEGGHPISGAGTAGNGGTTGGAGATASAGTTGTGGVSGNAGATGSAGTTGTGGVSGNAGATGSAGTTGTGGVSGNAGATGSAGRGGASGTGNGAGTAGAGGGGAAGSGGSGGRGGGIGSGGTTGGAGSGNGGSGGSAGSGGSSLDPNNLLANFEDPVAVIARSGTPPRNGPWYAFNDQSLSGDPTCLQTPVPGTSYPTSIPATFDGLPNNAGALHAQWTGCVLWGAIVGADLNQPILVGGGVYMGPKIPYDLTGYTGITFWARSESTADNKLRVKLVMTDETRIADGGRCDEVVVGTNKCSDSWGMVFSLPTNGNWQQVTVTFGDSNWFKQEGWGAVFPWNPAHVISIQFQSQGTEVGQSFDWWLDDVYLTK